MEVFLQIDGVRRTVEASEGATVLDVLQVEQIPVRAVCGGRGTCGRCQVLVRDGAGLNYRLACATAATEGMEVIVGRETPIDIVQEGAVSPYAPDEGKSGYGLAVDVGTTTLVAHLHDLATGRRLVTVSRANPQIAFGADVVSRISASIDGKLEPMHGTIVAALCDMESALCATAGVAPGEVCRRVLVGNTVMEHIAASLAPDTIGYPPFTPLSLFGEERDIPGLGPCYFARCIASYVGGDITAGLVARGLGGQGTQLFLDLGTNGEIVLVHDGRILCCATAAGPVFEGANIRFGMPASSGAISQVSWEGGRVQLGVLGGADPIGICGTGVIDAVAVMRKLGLVDASGRMLGPEELDGVYASLVGRVDGRKVFFLTPDGSLYLTQEDVRNVQLAKAAVSAGIHILADEAGIAIADIEHLEIAGGFGAYVNLDSAAAIGLIPAELAARAASVGNTAGEGASALLVSSEARTRETDIARRSEYIELSAAPAFNGLFVREMDFGQVQRRRAANRPGGESGKVTGAV